MENQIKLVQGAIAEYLQARKAREEAQNFENICLVNVQKAYSTFNAFLAAAQQELIEKMVSGVKVEQIEEAVDEVEDVRVEDKSIYDEYDGEV